MRMVLRVVLPALLVLGLVAMHHLAVSDDDGAGPVASTVQHLSGPTVAQGMAHGMAHEHGSGHGDCAGLLGACLAMLVAAVAMLLVLPLLPDRAVRPRAGLPAIASLRGPPLPRRLACLQVLRI